MLFSNRQNIISFGTHLGLMEFEPRFFKKIRKVKSGCWLWIGARSGGKNGDYGTFCVNGKLTYAHRASYEYFKEKIPKGLQIDHVCRKRTCVNPDHLEVVTQRENILRGEGISAVNARKTHCPRGHKYTPSNTYLQGTNRSCLKCRQTYRIRQQ